PDSREAYAGGLSRGGLPLLARPRAEGVDSWTLRRHGDLALLPRIRARAAALPLAVLMVSCGDQSLPPLTRDQVSRNGKSIEREEERTRAKPRHRPPCSSANQTRCGVIRQIQMRDAATGQRVEHRVDRRRQRAGDARLAGSL